MSNEELALCIQGGDATKILQLWKQVERFISMQAGRYWRRVKEQGTAPAFEVDDLVQEAYFAVVSAVHRYDPERGSFMNILDLCLRTAFSSVAGCRTGRQRDDGLNRSVSGDVPLGEDGDFTLLETIPAEGQSVEDEVTESIYQRQLHDVLDHALAGLSSKQEKILRRRYYQGDAVKDIAADMNCTVSNIGNHERDALLKLYNSRKLNGLSEFMEARTNYYMKTGVREFKTTGVSPVEKVILRREELAKRYLKTRRKGGKKA